LNHIGLFGATLHEISTKTFSNSHSDENALVDLLLNVPLLARPFLPAQCGGDSDNAIRAFVGYFISNTLLLLAE